MRHTTLFDSLTEEEPDLSHVRIFGSTVKVLKPKNFLDGKLGSEVWNGVHVGYAPGGAYLPVQSRTESGFCIQKCHVNEKLYENQPTVASDNGRENSYSDEAKSLKINVTYSLEDGP